MLSVCKKNKIIQHLGSAIKPSAIIHGVLVFSYLCLPGSINPFSFSKCLLGAYKGMSSGDSGEQERARLYPHGKVVNLTSQDKKVQ